jgi:protein-disulfide isomerase
MSEPHYSRRQALHAQQDAEVRAAKRKKLFAIIGGLVVVIAVIAAAIGVVNHHRSDAAVASGVTSAQITPPDGDARTGIYTVNSKTAKENAPTLTLYEDYQCPNCKQAEETYGPAIQSLAASGDIKLQYRTLTFLDNNYQGGSSYRAAMAAASADTVGKLEAYHRVVYAHQPDEGVGFTDDQLRNVYAREAGITGADLAKFQRYYDTKATSTFVKKAASEGLKAGSKLDSQFGTPFFTVNGKKYTDWQTLSTPTPSSLLASIKKAANSG